MIKSFASCYFQLLLSVTDSFTIHKIDKLPTEIFTSIFLCLDYYDELEYTTVSQEWNQLITDNVLYETSEIIIGVWLNKALNFFNARRELGKTVRRLIILRSQGALFSSLLSVPHVFPNVKYFEYHEEPDTRLKPIRYVDTDGTIYAEPSAFSGGAFQPWGNIVHIKEASSRSLILPLMLETAATPSTFSQVRVIELDLLFAPNNALDAVINNLHNAPGLKKLTPKDARRIGFNELEMIHSQAPNLEYLKLKDADLQPQKWQNWDQYQLGGELIPSAKLKSFAASFRRVYDDDFRDRASDTIGINWINYISMKYPSLIEI